MAQVPEPDITPLSLYMTVNGSTSTTVPCDQRVPTQSQNASLIFYSTYERSFPFHPLCDGISPVSRPNVILNDAKQHCSGFFANGVPHLKHEINLTYRTQVAYNYIYHTKGEGEDSSRLNLCEK